MSEYEEARKADMEVLKKEATEIYQLAESACKTTKGAEEFLRNYAEKITFKLNRGKEFKFFVVVIKKNNPLDNVRTIYFSQYSIFYSAKVTSDSHKNEYSKRLARKTTDTLKEAVFSIISNPQDHPNITIQLFN